MTGSGGWFLSPSQVNIGDVDEVELNYHDAAHYTVSSDDKGRIVREFELPNGLTLFGMPDSKVTMPTTQSKFNKLMYASYFTDDGDLATGSGTNVSAWDSTLMWYNKFDSNESSTASYRNNTMYTYLKPSSVPGASGLNASHFGDSYGAYPQTAISAALRTAEAEYLINNQSMSEAEAEAAVTAGYNFNLYSAPAPMDTSGVASYPYSVTSGVSSPVSVNMPAGNARITGSGVLNAAAINPYAPPVVYIDATADAIELQINGDFDGTYIILGKKKVNFILNGGPTATIVAGNNSSSLNWRGALIMREKNYAMWKAGATFGVGPVTGAEKSSIGDTNLYVSTGTKLVLGGGGGSYPTVIGANIYANKSTISNEAANIVQLKVDYNGITSNFSYCTVGAVLSSGYVKPVMGSINRTGNLFMSSDVPPEDGMPNFDWKSIRFIPGE
jgi:hypothetical protein